MKASLPGQAFHEGSDIFRGPAVTVTTFCFTLLYLATPISDEVHTNVIEKENQGSELFLELWDKMNRNDKMLPEKRKRTSVKK